MPNKSQSTCIVVYTPESPLRFPKQLASEMWRDLRASRKLAWRLAIRDFAAQYRQTVFGYFWAICSPLAVTGFWVIMNASQIISVKETGVPYPLYALIGTILWQLFYEALNAPLKQFTINRAMLGRINFPKEALVLSGLAQVVINFTIKLIIVSLVFIFFHIPVKWTAIFVPFPLLGLLMIGTLFGVILVPFGVLYRDIQEMITLFAVPLMLLAPTVAPLPAGGTLATIMRLNPLTPMILSVRQLLHGNLTVSLVLLGMIWVAALVLLLLGWLVYRVSLPILVERLEA